MGLPRSIPTIWWFDPEICWLWLQMRVTKINRDCTVSSVRSCWGGTGSGSRRTCPWWQHCKKWGHNIELAFTHSSSQWKVPQTSHFYIHGTKRENTNQLYIWMSSKRHRFGTYCISSPSSDSNGNGDWHLMTLFLFCTLIGFNAPVDMPSK